MTAIMWTACIWIVFAPVGYIVSRWSNRAMGGRWNQNDRFCAIVLSLLYGPMMLVVAAIVLLFDKLGTSEWGNRDAKW